MSPKDPGTGVLLLGSLPGSSAEECLGVSAQHLKGDVAQLPDGEFGTRRMWIGFLQVEIFPQLPGVKVVPGKGELDYEPDHSNPGQQVWKQHFVDQDRLDIEPGFDFKIDDLGYAKFAIESYETFKRLRNEGAIEEGVRFQVGLPGIVSAVDVFFVPEAWEQAEAAYADAVKREVEKILEVVPAEDLVIQFDVCLEIVDLSFGEQNGIPIWPDRTYDERFERYAATLPVLSSTVPENVALGYHFCYGTWGGWPMNDMRDLQIVVDLANEAVNRSARHVDYVHFPVAQETDDAFFAPLDQLKIGDTKVSLGMVHDDGVEGFKRRAEQARKHLPEFGVAHVCGYGREPESSLPATLDLHHDCLAALALMRQ